MNPIQKVSAIAFHQNQSIEVEDDLTVEEMLNISVNGEAYTTTMRTPGYEEELTRGILWTENVYQGIDNPTFSILEKNEYDFITKVNVQIPIAQLGNGINVKRNLMSVTSCGVCGKFELDTSITGEKIKTEIHLHSTQLQTMFNTMKQHQTQFAKTGGCHASAIFDAEYDLMSVFEDIGRHNAVDKAIGAIMLQATSFSKKALCILVSGRVSYEIVNKCYQARIPYLASVSAPSSLAVSLCKQKGITLFAFCRDEKVTQYS